MLMPLSRTIACEGFRARLKVARRLHRLALVYPEAPLQQRKMQNDVCCDQNTATVPRWRSDMIAKALMGVLVSRKWLQVVSSLIPNSG
jgi:hypothetical protein